MALSETDVFARLERFYDAVPRPYARAEEHGRLVLFVREGEGWPYYARPIIGAGTPSAADVSAVQQRQRDLNLPEAFEWVHESTPDLLAVARSAGLEVLLAPLLVLDAAALVPDLPVAGAKIRVLDPTAADYASALTSSRAVAQLSFGSPPGAAPLTDGPLTVAPAGPRERDAATTDLTESHLRDLRNRAAGGSHLDAVVDSPTEGILATGALMRRGDVAEIAGVATLPSARNRGYASQLTAALARQALTDGVRIVLLSAGDDDVARLYTKVGFRRVGTACIAEPAQVAP